MVGLAEIENAGVAELADALDLGSSVNRCAGSSPVTRTKEKVGNIVLPTLFLYETKLGQDLKATVKKQSGGLFLGRALMII